MATTLILSTRNPSKALQIKDIFVELPVLIRTLDEEGIEGEVVEDGSTLEENASKKALFAAQRSGKPSIADDTGIFIDALDGLPGIRSARWAGEDATTEEILRFTLEKLRDVPESKRTASFRTVAVLAYPDGRTESFTGEVLGTVIFEPRTESHPKMPYSAIFVPAGQSKVWTEMTVEEENAISHRGQAFRKMREYVRQHLA